MNSIWKLTSFSKKYPITRGMAAYAVIWPVSSLCQQAIVGKDKLDWAQASRYGFYGCFVVAPMIHGWIGLANAMWPSTSLKIAVVKSLVEQVSYAPCAVASFLFGMSLLEGRSTADAAAEVQTKFLPTFKVGACVWPVIQTVNFAFVSPKNRVVFVSVCSFLWTVQKRLITREPKAGTYEALCLADVSPVNYLEVLYGNRLWWLNGLTGLTGQGSKPVQVY
uniref:Uncharacterized protein n=1 Tax=Timema genevievae TaxID=629358 RepID=A0A7R9K7G4_TIMGE|nr:unnamed protein product [Timema genevievae]